MKTIETKIEVKTAKNGVQMFFAIDEFGKKRRITRKDAIVPYAYQVREELKADREDAMLQAIVAPAALDAAVEGEIRNANANELKIALELAEIDKPEVEASEYAVSAEAIDFAVNCEIGLANMENFRRTIGAITHTVTKNGRHMFNGGNGFLSKPEVAERLGRYGLTVESFLAAEYMYEVAVDARMAARLFAWNLKSKIRRESKPLDEDVFELLPTADELNDTRSDIEKEFDEFAAEYTDRDARFNHGERHAAEHINAVAEDVKTCIDLWTRAHGLTVDQCEQIYVAAHVDRDFTADVDRELIDRMIDNFKQANELTAKLLKATETAGYKSVTCQDGLTILAHFKGAKITSDGGGYDILTAWDRLLGHYDTPAQVTAVINRIKACVDANVCEFTFPTTDELNGIGDEAEALNTNWKDAQRQLDGRITVEMQGGGTCAIDKDSDIRLTKIKDGYAFVDYGEIVAVGAKVVLGRYDTPAQVKEVIDEFGKSIIGNRFEFPHVEDVGKSTVELAEELTAFLLKVTPWHAGFMDLTLQDGRAAVASPRTATIEPDWHGNGRFAFVTPWNEVFARYDTASQVRTVIYRIKHAVEDKRDKFKYPTLAELTAPDYYEKQWAIDFDIYHEDSDLDAAELESYTDKLREALTVNGNRACVELEDSLITIYGDNGGDNGTVDKIIAEMNKRDCWVEYPEEEEDEKAVLN